MKDFLIHGEGPATVFLLEPVSEAARLWADEHLPADALRLGRSIAVEHRFIGDIAEGIKADGLTIGLGR